MIAAQRVIILSVLKKDGNWKCGFLVANAPQNRSTADLGTCSFVTTEIESAYWIPGAGTTQEHPFRNHNDLVRHPARVTTRDHSFVKSVEL
jgi:hypothetical protein